MPYAQEFMQTLQDMGYCVTLLTARPLFEVKPVLYDTLAWMKKHGIQYDLIFQGKDKHIKLMKHFKEIDFMVEDNHKIANDVAEAGFTVYLVTNNYNQNVDLHSNVVRVDGLEQIIERIKNE